MSIKSGSETKKVLEEEKVIEHQEEKIEKSEKIIAKEESQIINIEKSLQEASKIKIGFIKKFARHKFIFSMIGGIGIVLVWRSIWDISTVIPLLQSSFVALAVGLGILWVLEKYSDL